MKKQINKINSMNKISRKQRLKLAQENADNELVLRYFFMSLIYFTIIAFMVIFIF